jgi:uncharacterized repeat protein (TIGR03803 family)
MSRIAEGFNRVVLCCGITAAAIVSTAVAEAKGFVELYAFQAESDGAYPAGALLRDKAGDLYGTTEGGGDYGYGTVFKLAPNGTETVLHDFGNANDGDHPEAGLIEDSSGNLYGTTVNGGTYNSGTVFKLAPDGTETVLYAFGAAGGDGGNPGSALLRDKRGNLYGTTAYGGAYAGGTVFELASDGTEKILHSFGEGNDGAHPYSKLIKDSSGNFYGTTTHGGANDYGVVFKLATDGTETVLYSFAGGTDGRRPVAGVIKDKAGNLYGTTAYGGLGWGTVFKLASDGTETVLYSFTGGNDGAGPIGGVLIDQKGNLYGTTVQGGSGCDYGCGTAFKLTPSGKEIVLHALTEAEGADPMAALVADKKGKLYGAASSAGPYGYGTVFKVKE